MSLLCWQGKPISGDAGDTALEALLAAGIVVPSSCRSGACQTCLVKAPVGPWPAEAQRGLSETLKAQGYLLACQARLSDGLRLDLVPADDLPAVTVTVTEIQLVGGDVAILRLSAPDSFSYRPGQFVHVVRGDGLTRSYSLASHPSDGQLELHVRRLPGGRMSGYLCEDVKAGDSLLVRGPSGSCFYVEGRAEQPLVLAGTGTGLAPLLGIARAALSQGHQGSISLFHGAVEESGLYAHETLSLLAQASPLLTYRPFVLRGETARTGAHLGALQGAVLAAVKAAPRSRVFLCGAPEFVTGMQRDAFLAGARMSDILADAFVTA